MTDDEHKIDTDIDAAESTITPLAEDNATPFTPPEDPEGKIYNPEHPATDAKPDSTEYNDVGAGEATGAAKPGPDII